jgi:hypothetical protein
MGNDFKPTPRNKTILDNPKLRLSADKLPNGESRPSFTLYWIGNNPRIDVWTGVSSEKDGGRIRATLDDLWARVFLDKILELCNPAAPNDSAYIIECKNHTWQNNKRSQEPVVESRIVAGRDKDGRVYVSVLSADPQRSKVRFLFGNTFYNTLSYKNEKLSDAQISWTVASAWANSIINYYGLVAAESYVHKTAENKNGGGNKGNNQSYRNNGNSNNSSSVSDEYGDDLPF